MEQPPSDFDGAWKEALDRYFEPFLALFFPQAHAAIDWTQPTTFRDTELQQIAPEETQGKQRVDRLVAVVQRDGTPALVLIHIEIQSQRDGRFAERMFRYHARIFDREQQPVVSLAVLGDEDASWQPTSFGYALWGCELALHFPTVKLLALDTVQLANVANPIATLALLHRDALETRGRPQERAGRKVERFRTMLRLGYSADDVRALLRLMEYMLRVDTELALLVRDQLRQVEQEETGMSTFVTSFEEIGFAKGKAEGQLEGQVAGQRTLMMHQLTRKIGPLTEELRTQLEQLSSPQLLLLSEALLDFAGVEDLVAWLNAQEAP